MSQARQLDYSRPYFCGEFNYRNKTVIISSIVVMGLMSIGFGFVAALPTSLVPRLLRAGFLACFVFAIGCLAYMIYGAITGLRRRFAIGPDGVLYFGKFIPWPRIVQFAAYGVQGSKAVTMFFATRPMGMPYHLVCHPSVSAAQYEELLTVLRTEVAPLHPDLKVGGYFTESS